MSDGASKGALYCTEAGIGAGGASGDTVAVLAAVRHLAVYAACYVAAQAVAACLLTGVAVSWRIVAVATLTAIGTYLVDRSGPWPGLPDRGDLRAEPERVRFLRRYTVLVRCIAIGAPLIAFGLALPWGPWVAVAPLSVIGLLCYSKWAMPGRRIKDRLLLKNAAVAVSIAALAVALSRAGGGAAWLAMVLVGPMLVLRVMADAMRCDIDDVDADRREGTRTVANVFGVSVAWRVALVLDVCAAGAALALVPTVGWGVSLAVGSVPLIGGIALTVIQPKPSRDCVDALGAIGVLVAWGLISVGL